MKEENDKIEERTDDDVVRIIRRDNNRPGGNGKGVKPKTGAPGGKRSFFSRYWPFLTMSAVLIILIIVISVALSRRTDRRASENYNVATKYTRNPDPIPEPIRNIIGYSEFRDTIVNDIPLQIITPFDSYPQLVVGESTVNRQDASIVLAVKAADFSQDGQGNWHIVGDFAAGKFVSSKGENKDGFCAIVDSVITVGVDPSSERFTKAKDMGGDFFRNVPLVANGEFVTTNPKGKAYRRAICQSDSSTFIVIARSKESFHDFAQALADMKVDNAISLLGGECVSGWAVGKDDSVLEIGTAPASFPEKCVNYIVWKSK